MDTAHRDGRKSPAPRLSWGQYGEKDVRSERSTDTAHRETAEKVQHRDSPGANKADDRLTN